MDNVITKFKEKNLKLTPQRIAVYKYLKSTTSHPSAETIYKALLTDYPTISLATVYKSLKVLVEVNLIQELNVGEGKFRYDANVESHPHIQCMCCGEVDDIYDLDLNKLNAEVKNYTNYDILSNKVYFYGICPNCKKSNNK